MRLRREELVYNILIIFYFLPKAGSRMAKSIKL